MSKNPVTPAAGTKKRQMSTSFADAVPPRTDTCGWVVESKISATKSVEKCPLRSWVLAKVSFDSISVISAACAEFSAHERAKKQPAASCASLYSRVTGAP